jgi:hypothetical protein
MSQTSSLTTWEAIYQKMYEDITRRNQLMKKNKNTLLSDISVKQYSVIEPNLRNALAENYAKKIALRAGTTKGLMPVYHSLFGNKWWETSYKKLLTVANQAPKASQEKLKDLKESLCVIPSRYRASVYRYETFLGSATPNIYKKRFGVKAWKEYEQTLRERFFQGTPVGELVNDIKVRIVRYDTVKLYAPVQSKYFKKHPKALTYLYANSDYGKNIETLSVSVSKELAREMVCYQMMVQAKNAIAAYSRETNKREMSATAMEEFRARAVCDAVDYASSIAHNTYAYKRHISAIKAYLDSKTLEKMITEMGLKVKTGCFNRPYGKTTVARKYMSAIRAIYKDKSSDKDTKRDFLLATSSTLCGNYNVRRAWAPMLVVPETIDEE